MGNSFHDLTVKITGDETNRLLSCLQKRGYLIKKVTMKDDALLLSMNYRDFLASKDIFHKCHVKISIIKKNKSMQLLRKRKAVLVFLILAAAFLLLIIQYSNRIWTIQVTGNEIVSSKAILDDLKKMGIMQSTPQSNINSIEIAERLRKDFDAITWVSVDRKGTFLFIDVRENRYKNELKYTGFSDYPIDLVADKEGTISTMVVRSGTPMVHIGDMICPGTVLVSGTVVFVDNQGEVQTRYICSDAVITIQYEKSVSIYQSYNDIPENDLFNLEARMNETLENNLAKIILSLEEKGVTIKEKNVTIESNYEGKTLYCTFILQETVGVLQDGNVSDDDGTVD